ncbi:glycerophosphodiester phosphodiesterase family protein [Georgenia sp. Z1344]|uniref:glycerophosphodiester phosphodiesterase family protein n=1 Tax=Georgenia sp. Z1344 TaxID=3416706 RepID=UPI003CE8967C
MAGHLFDGVGPVAIAHRGGRLEVPENTAAAVAHAAALGVVLETDARLTADGEVVLFHDDDLARTTSATGPIEDLDLARVQELSVEGGGAPARLADVLAAHPDLRLNIDAKTDEVAAPLVEVVAAAGAADRVCLAAFSDARLARMRELLPVPASLGPGDVARLVVGSVLPVVGPMLARRVPGPDAGVVAVQVPERYRGVVPVVTRRFVAAAHRRGLQVHVWTVNEKVDMERLLDLGVDGIITDRPTLLVEVLSARGPWH